MILPTKQQLYDDNIARLETAYNITIPQSGPKNFFRAWSSVTAGVTWLLYKALAKVQKNVFVDTADSESKGGTLERFGRVYLGRNPFPAQAGEYTIQLTIDSAAIGNIIPAQTQFKSNDDSLNPGQLFILDSPFTIDGVDIITVRALEAGTDSKLDIGNEISLTAPIALVEKNSTVLTESTQPQAAEDLEDYREKIIDAIRLEPQGGAGADYRLWSADAQGVKQSYPYTNTVNSNEVDLFVEATIADSSDGQGTPTASILSDVESAVEDPTTDRPSRKPIGVHSVNYLPISVRQVDIEINGYVGIDVIKQAAIATAIGSYLDEVRPYVSSIDVLADKNDIFDTNIIVSLILSAVPGSSFGTVVLKIDSVPMTSYQFLYGNIPNLNTITYV